MSASANIAQHLPLMAARQPDRPALKIPRGRTARGDIDYLSLTFSELDAEVDAWAAHMQGRGVKAGDRTLVMVRQGLPLIAAAFALFKIGAVPIVIDPGMGLKSFLSCVARSQPRVLLGIPFAQIISRVAQKSFRSVRVRVTASGNPLARRTSALATRTPVLISRSASDLAAILFTSGSTGAPKGVCYEHGMFDAQVRLIRETYAIEPGEIDLPMLPIFALFNPALGMTTVVPEIDPSKPAAVDPAKIVQAIQQERVTNSFGSPTLWGKIADHCLARDITLPSMKRVLCAGAPVPSTLWEKSKRLLSNGQLHSPYGATESLPISTVSASDILVLDPATSSTICHPIDDKTTDPMGETAKKDCHLMNDKRAGAFSRRGACVGRPVNGIEVKIIAISDAPIAMLADARELLAGEIGEIVVSGPVVTKEYDSLPDATAAAKIKDVSGAIWHRIGDCGYRDAEGRLWFCGRKAERVITANAEMFTEPYERTFRSLPGVARCALVGLGERGAQIPAIIVQPTKRLSAAEAHTLAITLREHAKQNAQTAMITRFYFHPNFPVDVRHNAKIHRLTLAKWAVTAQVHEIL